MEKSITGLTLNEIDQFTEEFLETEYNVDDYQHLKSSSIMKCTIREFFQCGTIGNWQLKDKFLPTLQKYLLKISESRGLCIFSCKTSNELLDSITPYLLTNTSLEKLVFNCDKTSADIVLPTLCDTFKKNTNLFSLTLFSLKLPTTKNVEDLVDLVEESGICEFSLIEFYCDDLSPFVRKLDHNTSLTNLSLLAYTQTYGVHPSFSFTDLSHVLSVNSTLIKLNLSEIEIPTHEDCESIFTALQKNQTLKSLRLGDVDSEIKFQQWPSLETLIRVNSTLEKLSIIDYGFSLGKKAVIAISNALLYNETLTFLHVSESISYFENNINQEYISRNIHNSKQKRRTLLRLLLKSFQQKKVKSSFPSHLKRFFL